jgi:hypothetical protein
MIPSAARWRRISGVPASVTTIPASVPTSILIPPFAFAGRGGRSKYLVPIDKMGWEPRFGFAWSPKMKPFGLDLEKRSVVVRGGYGISHATLTGITDHQVLTSEVL